MKSIIICATPRSGSYLLSDLLNRKGMPFAEEWLTQFHQESRKRAYGVKGSIDYISFIRMLTEREGINGLFSMKVMFPQFSELVREIAESDEIPGSDLMDKFCNLFPEPHFIRVSRENKIAQAISLLKARQTGHWVKRRGEDLQNEIEPVYSFLGILDSFEERRRSEQLWDEFFEEHPSRTLELSYEELVADKEGVLESIFHWAGLDYERSAKKEDSSTFQPMRSSTNTEWAQRFEQDMESSFDEGPFRQPADLPQLQISGVDVPKDYIVGNRYILYVTCQADPESRISPVGRKDGHDWLRVSGLLSGKGFSEIFEQELQPIEANGFVSRCVLPMPEKAGPYTLKLVLSSRRLEVDEISAIPGLEQEVTFSFPPARQAARRLFPETRDLDDSWQHLEWFGYFLDDKFPWIYHADHEWLYCKPEASADGTLHMLDAQLGWLEVNPALYPVVKCIKTGKRLSFLKRVDDKRLFKDLDEGEVREFETNRPEHLEKLNSENE